MEGGVLTVVVGPEEQDSEVAGNAGAGGGGGGGGSEAEAEEE